MVITQISPEETPLLSKLGVSRAYSTYHNWLTDGLLSATATGGQCIEGNSAVERAISDRTRALNYTQITQFVFTITGTQEAVSHYGLDSEYSYQLEKALKSFKIMQESMLFNSTSSVGAYDGGVATAARSMNGLLEAIQTTICTGYASACALTESMFNTLLQNIFTQGGTPDTVFCAGFNKRRISSFATSNTRTLNMDKGATLRNFVSVYESDFGTLSIMLDRYCPTRSVPIIEVEKFKVAYLRKPKVVPLAIDGDRTSAMVIGEYTLEYLNEKGSGRFDNLANS